MTSPVPETAHPLAERLLASIADAPLRAPVIEVGSGAGRNTRALVAAGVQVVSVPDDVPYTQLPGTRENYGAALSTHAYLHGTTEKLRAGFADLRRVLVPQAPIFVTLGSIRDVRYGLGTAFDERSFAPGDGDEAGIPHAYFDRDGILELMRGFFHVEEAAEVVVDDIVGRWAHGDEEPLQGRVHWWVLATRL